LSLEALFLRCLCSYEHFKEGLKSMFALRKHAFLYAMI
jgi:hypothetical protein